MSEDRQILSDAIKTALDYSHKVIILKRTVYVMGFVIIALICGYFI